VLEKTASGDPASIAMVSLSTTLATNAIAEGKRKRWAAAAGIRPRSWCAESSTSNSSLAPPLFFHPGRHNLNGVEQEALDEAQVAEAASSTMRRWRLRHLIFMPADAQPGHEETRREILAGLTGQPVVQATTLSSELDSIRRATTPA